VDRTQAIGGYFALELTNGVELHEGALSLNSARNCFKYILQGYKPSKIYLPYYICDSIVDVAKSSCIAFEFYALNKNMGIPQSVEPQQNELLLYVNYFGLKTAYANKLADQFGSIVIDNSQAFFIEPNSHAHTIYSPRKFFGVPDGGYLYTDLPTEVDRIPEDTVIDRCCHLLGRIESGSQAYYSTYQEAESAHNGRPIRKMSRISKRILASLDYESIALKRERNFLFLHTYLAPINTYPIEVDATFKGPMIYPLLMEDGSSLKEKLIEEQIYVATYWAEVKTRDGVPPLECSLVDDLVPLPIDQRYTLADMQRIVTVIKDWLAERI
jgi:hypothetical protein